MIEAERIVNESIPRRNEPRQSAGYGKDSTWHLELFNENVLR